MKILVIGCGSIGRRHAINAAQLCDTAVYDADCDRANSVATELGIQLFDTLDAALDWGADGVVVATPHDSHVLLARQALETGAHILVEKPISHDLQGVNTLIEEAERRGRKLHVVCNMRFHPGVTALHEHLDKIGTPLYARAYFGHYLPNMRPNVDYRTLYAANPDQGGGVILDAVHEIDYLSWFFGPVEDVVAEVAKLSTLEIESEDFATLCLTHASGVRTTLQLDYLQRFKQRGCEIIGSEGTLIWRSEGKSPEYCTVSLYRSNNDPIELLYSANQVNGVKPFQELMQAFLASMQGTPTCLASGSDGNGVLKAALAALQCQRNKA